MAFGFAANQQSGLPVPDLEKMKAEVKLRNADMESQKSHKSFFSQRNQKPAASTRNPRDNLQPLVAASKPPKFVTNQFKLMMFANGGLTSQ